LRPFDAEDTGIERADGDLNKLSARLKVKSDEHHYFCQSTELLKSTTELRGCGSLGEECLCYGEPGDFPRGELILLSQSVAAFAQKNHIFERTHLFSMRRG
jgi:hypothetical protein